MKIITCTGFGNSGSSAATDFFSEFDNVEIVPHDFEFTFIHENDGLFDLECAVREGHRLKVDLAVKRFILLVKNLNEKEYSKYFGDKFIEYTRDFLEDAIGCKWEGWWHRVNEMEPLSFRQRSVLRYIALNFEKEYNYSLYENDKWNPQYLPPTNEYYESDIKNFLICAKKYICRLMETLNCNHKEFLVVDQLLPPTNAELYFHYFDDLKVIIVDRDPRDYFFANNVFWGSRYIPSFDLNTYILWFNETRSLVHESSYIKKIYLEDLIYNYDIVTADLINFSKMNKSHWINKKRFFVPEKSETNTKLFCKYNGFENEIEIISNQLSNYLFDYNFDNKDETIKKDVIPIKKLIEKYDTVYKKRKISFVGIIISIRVTILKFFKDKND